MSITPMSPALIKQGWVQTWVTSQWKNPSIPGQFSAEINTLPEEQVAEPARKALAHVKSSPDVRRMLIKGLSLKGAKSDAWLHIPSETGANDGVSKMGLLAWNFAFPATALAKGDLSKAGVIILIKDRQQGDATGLEEVMRSGLVAAAQQADETVTAEEASGAATRAQQE